MPSPLAMQQGTRLALIGDLLGSGGGAVAARLVESRLLGVTSLDPVTFGLAAALLSATALVACYVPAR